MKLRKGGYKNKSHIFGDSKAGLILAPPHSGAGSKSSFTEASNSNTTNPFKQISTYKQTVWPKPQTAQHAMDLFIMFL